MKYVLFCLFFSIFTVLDNIYTLYKMSSQNEDRIGELILGNVVALVVNGIGLYFFFISGVI